MTDQLMPIKLDLPANMQLKPRIQPKDVLAQLPLKTLRQAMNLSQVKLASKIDTKQANISRIEHREDMYISTLTNYVWALGGKLEISAVFPEGQVQITQFDSKTKRKKTKAELP